MARPSHLPCLVQPALPEHGLGFGVLGVEGLDARRLKFRGRRDSHNPTSATNVPAGNSLDGAVPVALAGISCRQEHGELALLAQSF